MNTKPTLFLITGTSGTGKSTLVPLLANLLSEKYAVYDWDEIYKPYDGEPQWEHEVMTRSIALAEKNAAREISTVIAGLIRPQIVKKFTKAQTPEIQFCLLTITADERARRLKERGAPEHLINDHEELLSMEQWLQGSDYPFITINTMTDTPKTIAEKLVTWILKLS